MHLHELPQKCTETALDQSWQTAEAEGLGQEPLPPVFPELAEDIFYVVLIYRRVHGEQFAHVTVVKMAFNYVCLIPQGYARVRDDGRRQERMCPAAVCAFHADYAEYLESFGRLDGACVSPVVYQVTRMAA